MEAPAPSATKRYFGEVRIDPYMWANGVVFTPGLGAESFDPAVHKEDDRKDAFNWQFIPLRGNPWRAQVMVIGFGDWPSTIKPSLDALGEDVRKWTQANGVYTRYVSMEITDTGKVNKKGYAIKDTKIVAVYDTVAACQKAADEFFANPNAAATEAPVPTPPQPSAPGMSYENALKTLKAFWKGCNGDASALAKKVAAMPSLVAHFGTDADALKVIAEG